MGRSSVTAHLDLGRRVALRALAAFLLAFVILRVITAIIHFELFPHGPFRNLVTKSGLHIHHLFWGILLLMLTGFVALATRSPVWHLRIAIVFGIALALTLDEFALWLNLEPNDYWSREGRLSVDAVILFGAILATGAWGAPFFRGLGKMWSKRKVVGRGLAFPIRHARLLRPRRFRKRPPHSAQQ